MSAPNLTRDQARQRAAILSVQNYRIELDLTDGAGAPGTERFGSTTTVTFSATAGATTFIDLVAPKLVSATLNGEELDVSAFDESTGLELPGLAAENTLEVVAECAYSNTGEGLHRFVDPADGNVYLYSQFETADAKRMFACFDQPDLKASYSVTVTAPGNWQVISNGAPTGEPGTAADGALVHRFATTERFSTYLVALIAGPYAVWNDEYSDEHGTIPLGLYCRASLAEHMDAERLFAETKQGFGFYHRVFGVPYAFGKYDQLFVPEFNAGAMENAGAVTFLEDYVFRSRVTRYLYERRAETVLHEMAHMWFGDLVTMQWWDDLWLNESFATFASVLSQVEATEYTNAWTTFANVEKSWAYRQDQLPSTHPIAADIPDIAAVEVNFDGITYAKGASVLKQLVAYVGLEPFLTGLREYFAEHRFANATFADLLGSLERASGRDLSGWGAQWLKTTGINVMRPEFETDANGRFTSFAVLQEGAAPGAGETRVHRMRIGVYADEGGKLVRSHVVELDVEGPRTDVPDLIGVERGRLVLLNDDDLTYASVRLDADSLATATARIADIADPMPRTLIWSAAWEMTRQAEMSARDFLTLVGEGIGAESEVGVVQRVLLQAVTALESYADPAWAAQTGWPTFAGRLLTLAQNAESGSDHQLAFVNALLGGVTRDDQQPLLRALLDGDEPADHGLPGLVVDDELRWKLVKALATHGIVGDDVIDAEARRDNTAAGARHAEAARAARPDAEAKATAWTRAFDDDGIANVTVRSIVEGLVRPGQSELLSDYTQRYFDEVAALWDRRTSEVAQTVVIGLYPSWDITDAALQKADAFLAGDHPPALARLIAEGRDSTARALRARDRDRRSSE
ncbi:MULTISPECIES: aminopeptidase N [Gordonia]|uniref:Aminopeptidase N n=1 Tax=Gordonia sihwensis NBRC 108236 TaxID=1223544 RepID=L7LMF4_9ACTN|nr:MULTISPECIES: aminopeptidase N [Gordonia]AUH69355.1 aminopeptidase N [Gordonia sp. YC-JH1]MBY4571740.1 aminopeptidase N [Gordonia sihwensis]GAC61223.1 aminopeptidase N [Gordonia sihwensis NBRC 108236]